MSNALQYLGNGILLQAAETLINEVRNQGKDGSDPKVAFVSDYDEDSIKLDLVLEWSNNSGYVNSYYDINEINDEIKRREKLIGTSLVGFYQFTN